MNSQSFGALVTPRGAGSLRRRRFEGGGEVMSPQQLNIMGGLNGGSGMVDQDVLRGLGAQIGRKPPPDDIMGGDGALGGIIGGAVSPWAPQFPSPDMEMFTPYDAGGAGGGGGGGMAHGGRVRMFDGGDVGGDSDATGGSMGGWGDPGGAMGRDAADLGGALAGLDGGAGVMGWGDPIDAATRNTEIGMSPMAERGLLGILGSIVGVPGLGLAATVAEKVAGWAEGRGIATDRDRSTGISAGHNASRDPSAGGPQGALELGHFGDDVPLQGGPSARDLGGLPPGSTPGALEAPGAALAPISMALPSLQTLQQPQIDPRTYGMGPAAAWLR